MERKIFQYRLLAVPSKEFKRALDRELGSFNHLIEDSGRLPYELLLADFIAHEEMEETVIRWVRRSIVDFSGFAVWFNNYGITPPDSVFLRVMDPAPFRELSRLLKPLDEYVQSNQYSAVRFVQQPCLPLGSCLEPGLADLISLDFHESFELEELVLVRKETQESISEKRAVLRLKDPVAIKN